MKKMFKDMKAGDSAWLLYYSTERIYIEELVYSGNLKPDVIEDKVSDFESKNGTFPGCVWYKGDHPIKATASVFTFFRNWTIYFNKEDACDMLWQKLADRWSSAKRELERWERNINEYFEGDKESVDTFKAYADNREKDRLEYIKKWRKENGNL